MSIRLSIYDFFAYTIPGSLYLFIIGYICSQFGLLQIDLLNFTPSLFLILVIAGSAYILGMIFEPLAKAWYRLFTPKNLPEKVLKKYQENRPHIVVEFKATDWPILMAYIRRESIELAEYIERDNAYNLMLRSLSLGFALLAITQAIQFALTLSVLYVGIAVICAFASIISLKFSLTFAKWFYLLIYETTTARVVQGLDKVILKSEASKESKESQKS